MKKRANILTRIALALTVFTTTMAGVAPMTVVAAKYTVSFDANTGSGTMAAQEVDTGTESSVEYTLPENGFVAPNGKHFKHWEVNSTQKSPGETITVNSAVSVKAIWEDGKELKSIAVTTMPTLTTYTIGDLFNQSGMAVTATYTDNSSAVVSGFKYKTTALEATDTSFAITYQEGSVEKSTNITLTINSATTQQPITWDPSGTTVNSGGKITVTTNPAANIALSYSYTGGSGSKSATNSTSASFDVNSDMVTAGTVSVTATITATATGYTDRTETKTYTINKLAGTKAKIDSIKWSSGKNGAELGTTFSALGKTYSDDPLTEVYTVSGTKEFPNGTTNSAIIEELKKSSQVDIDLDTESRAHPEPVKWLTSSSKSSTVPYVNTTDSIDNNQMNTYDVDSDDEQTFTVYSDPIPIWGTKDKYRLDDLGTQNIRLKLTVKVLKAGASGSTGTGNVAAPTFSPASGAYVFPGAKITMSSTTSGVSFRSNSGTNMPTTSSGTSGATIAIPSGTSAGEYKLNAIAYTSTSAYSDVASATYTVVTDTSKYAITEGSGQSASSAMPISFTSNGDLSNFKALYIADAFVPEMYYTKASGSTIVTLSPTYWTTTQGQAAGSTPTVRMVFTDGYASGNFTLTAGGAATPINGNETANSTSGGGRANTGTDDRSNLVIMFVVLGMLIAGFSGAVYFKNEKLRRNRYMD